MATPERLDALTGLRFVAAAAVFIYHVPNWLQVPAFNPGPLGQAAVGYFFVLSGFILAHVYRRDGAVMQTGRFYLARFARIWPLHAACLLAMLAVRPESWPRTMDQSVHFLAHAALLQGWTTDSSRALAWNGPAWSLSVEAFFYVLFPLLVRFRPRALIACYAACCLLNAALYALADARAVQHPEQIPAWAYFASSFPLPRLQEFVLGICTHDAWRHFANRGPRTAFTATVWELAAMAAAVVSFLLWGSGAWATGRVAPMTAQALAQGPGYSWAFAATIALCAFGRGWISRVLATRTMVYLGEISYAFYLVHTPVMTLVGAGMQDFAFLWQVPAVVGVTATLAAAALLHALVELPARQAILARGAPLSSRPGIYLATAAKAARSRACRVVVALGIGGLAFGLASPPTVQDFARGIVRESQPALRGIRYATAFELLGATLFANSGGFLCWIAMRADDRTETQAVFEARTSDGKLVHTLATKLESVVVDGTRTRVLTAQATLPELVGAAVLALVVRGADGVVIAPPSGPIAADRMSLEILRLP